MPDTPATDQSLGAVSAPPDPFAKFKTPSDKWNNATKREYNQMASDAYADGAASGKDKQCENSSGAVASKGGGFPAKSCGCRHCSGAHAVFELQKSVAGYDPTEDLKSKGY